MAVRTRAKQRVRFSARAFVASFLLLSGVVVGLSGVYLYTPGFAAHIIGLRFLGLDFRHWAILHTVFSVFFVLFAAFHVIYNWRPLLRYLSGRVHAVPRWYREAGLSLAVVLLLSFSSWAYVFPAGPLWEFRTTLRVAWVDWGMGSLSVADLAKKVRASTDQVLKRFAKYGVKACPEDRLSELAERVGVHVYDLYQIARGRRPLNRPKGGDAGAS